MPARGEAKGQDWKPVVFEDPRRARKSAEAAGTLGTSRQATKGGGNGSSLLQRLEHETEELSHLRVSTELKKALMQARLAKNLTQKKLATQLNLPAATIADLENGTALVDNALVARLEKHLGCTLPRTHKKKTKGAA